MNLPNLLTEQPARFVFPSEKTLPSKINHFPTKINVYTLKKKHVITKSIDTSIALLRIKNQILKYLQNVILWEYHLRKQFPQHRRFKHGKKKEYTIIL